MARGEISFPRKSAKEFEPNTMERVKRAITLIEGGATHVSAYRETGVCSDTYHEYYQAAKAEMGGAPCN